MAVIFFQPVKRSLISDFVGSVRALYEEAHQLALHKDSVLVWLTVFLNERSSVIVLAFFASISTNHI